MRIMRQNSSNQQRLKCNSVVLAALDLIWLAEVLIFKFWNSHVESYLEIPQRSRTIRVFGMSQTFSQQTCPRGKSNKWYWIFWILISLDTSSRNIKTQAHAKKWISHAEFVIKTSYSDTITRYRRLKIEKGNADFFYFHCIVETYEGAQCFNRNGTAIRLRLLWIWIARLRSIVWAQEASLESSRVRMRPMWLQNHKKIKFKNSHATTCKHNIDSIRFRNDQNVQCFQL